MLRRLMVLIPFTAAMISGCVQPAKPAQPAASGIDAIYVQAGIEKITPEAEIWAKAPRAAVSMLPQDLTEPKQMSGITTVSVSSLCDNERVAFLISWDDATKDEIDEGGRYSDAAAVQLPLAAGPNVPDPTMGQAGQPVNIHLWKASYQRRLELDEWTLQQDFPNATVDHYPFEAAPPERKQAAERQYAVSIAAGNPLGSSRTSSVDDLSAEGFGTVAHLPEQVSDGMGRWESGRWNVVISRPLAIAASGLEGGDKTFVAFAVWDGSQGQAGSRKMRSAWVPLRLEKEQ